MAVPPLDRATIDAARKRAADARAFWDAHREELTQKYPDEFVAMRDGTVIDHDRDFMVLTGRLERAGVRLTELSIERMVTEPEYYLL